MVGVLESITPRTERTELIRLASLPKSSEFFQAQGLDERGIDEALQFLEARGITTQPEALVDKAFKPKARLAKTRYATRFSDGSFPVLYGAMEAPTAEAEVKQWFSKQVSGKPTHARTAWYLRFMYHFNGNLKDLRPKQAEREWRALTHDNNYRFCNNLGVEAVAAGLDGLLAPSVRNAGGTNLPAFARRAVSNFLKGGFVSITYNPQTGETFLKEAT